MMKAILFVGHGTRVPEGNEQVKAFTKKAGAAFPEYEQKTCFLELAEPDIVTSAVECIENGADTLAVVPVLLLSAGHIKKDIPEELEKVQQMHPEVTIQYGDPFGVHDRINDLLMDRLHVKGWEPEQEAVILFVGRGAKDPGAIEDFYRIAGELEKHTGRSRVETAFLAAAEPGFQEKMKELAEGERPVYVLPYLMFVGLLIKEMDEAAAHYNQTKPGHFTRCDFLGFDERLLPVLESRVAETLEKDAGIHV